MSNPKSVLAICLKSYQDEDDYQEYLDGIRSIDEVRTYIKGEKHFVVDKYYNKEYYKVIEPKIYEKP